MSAVAGVLPVTREEAETFLFHEARLADEGRYQEWLSLWDDEGDIRYWVPCNSDDVDPMSHVSLIYDDRHRLEERIVRLESPSTHAQDPVSRLRRLVGNVEVSPGSADNTAHVEANFIVVEFRRGDQVAYAGRSLYDLRVRDGGLRIASKKVLLVNNDGFIGNLTFLL